jgi:hypothetical protein
VCNPFSFKDGGGIPSARNVASMFPNGHVPKWTLFIDILGNLHYGCRCSDQTQQRFRMARRDRLPTIGPPPLHNLIVEVAGKSEGRHKLGNSRTEFLVTPRLHRTSNCQMISAPFPGRELGRESNNIQQSSTAGAADG